MRYVMEKETFERYIERFNELFINKEKYVIFGSQFKAAEVRKKISNVLFYVDNDKEKWGELIDGLEIKNPEVLKYQNVKIIVAVSAYLQVFEQLKNYGISEENYCSYKELLLIKEYLDKGTIYLPQIIFITNSRCTLTCKGCIEYIPYIQKKKDFSFEEIISSVDNLFKCAEYVENVQFAGGEAFLHEKLGDIIKYCYEKYIVSDRAGNISVVTNATLIPNENLLNALKKYNVHVVMSNYKKAIQNKCKIEELVEIFEQRGIKYNIENHFNRLESGKWFDMGSPFFCHNMTEIELKKYFEKCTISCFAVCDSKLFTCNAVRSSIMNLERIGTDNDYCDLRVDSKMKFLKYYLGYNDKGYYDFCNFCNGFGEYLNKTSIVPGEQGVL